LLDSIQNYVDLAVAREDDVPEYQKPLFDATPTINGMMMREMNETYVNNFNGADEGEWSQPSEESPFRNEAPVWMRSDGDDGGDNDEDENRVEVAPMPPPVLRQPTTPAPAPTKPAVMIVEKPASPPVQPEPIKVSEVTPAAVAPAEMVEGVMKNGAANGAHPPSLDKPIAVAPPPVAAPECEEPPLHRAPVVVNHPEVSNPPPVEIKKSESNGVESNGNGKHASENGTKARNGNGAHPASTPPPIKHARQPQEGKRMQITFRRSGDLERDKFRLKEIYDRVRDPRGRDHFFILLEANGKRYELAFPNDPCTISDRLVKELTKHFRVEVNVDN